MIGGMTCGACAARIEKRLNLLEGVEARVNYASERATATFPVDVPVERLIAEVAAAGYRAELPSQEAGPAESDDARTSTGGSVRCAGACSCPHCSSCPCATRRSPSPWRPICGSPAGNG